MSRTMLSGVFFSIAGGKSKQDESHRNRIRDGRLVWCFVRVRILEADLQMGKKRL